MFTGIIEATGRVESIVAEGTGKVIWITSPLSPELKTDQSLSHNGVCLTVEQVRNGSHRVTAILETLSKTEIGNWKPGDTVNLERCMQLNGRLDGHIVQGHVDTTGACLSVTNQQGSWEYRFSYPSNFAGLIIEKGSICVNGISLTAFDVADDAFSVAIIPYTHEHTNIANVVKGSPVNLEFDVVGKYIQRLLPKS
jgi:riboflavin synthase